MASACLRQNITIILIETLQLALLCFDHQICLLCIVLYTPCFIYQIKNAERGRKRTKTRTHKADAETIAGTLTNAEEQKVPKSLVVSSEIGRCWCCLFSAFVLFLLMIGILPPPFLDSSRKM